jgi:hypothetical protein
MVDMVHEVFGDFLLVLHTDNLPSDDEWRSYINSIAKMPTRVRQLVFTDGGGPTSKQRAELNEVLRSKLNTGSVISSNRMIRYVVAAVNWLGAHNVRSFAPNELKNAMQYIGVTDEEVPRLLTRLAALAVKLSCPLTCLPSDPSRGPPDPPA